jgi:hypothetical protein
MYVNSIVEQYTECKDRVQQVDCVVIVQYSKQFHVHNDDAFVALVLILN